MRARSAVVVTLVLALGVAAAAAVPAVAGEGAGASGGRAYKHYTSCSATEPFPPSRGACGFDGRTRSVVSAVMRSNVGPKVLKACSKLSIGGRSCDTSGRPVSRAVYVLRLRLVGIDRVRVRFTWFAKNRVTKRWSRVGADSLLVRR